MDVKMKATALGACILIIKIKYGIDRWSEFKRGGILSSINVSKPINRYFVTDGTGNKVFSILEDRECCDRYFCADVCSFIMNITDVSNQKIISLVHSTISCFG
ncbi:hypothetical protein cypCar_00039808, partial [Cyprinus carpio]